MLYLVATPIGNLSDFTLRAIETLKHSDYILCEDTRHSRILLNHFEITVPLKSFHQFSEASKEEQIILDLKAGKRISLISDAGTPGISDPGSRLVKRCYESCIAVSPIPGPCAAIAALCASGLDTERFQFIGFLPRKENALKNAVVELLDYPGTSICYESPKRLSALLAVIAELDPLRPLVIAREVTKKFEEFLSFPAAEAIVWAKDRAVKGEITLLIAPSGEKRSEWAALTPEEHVSYLVDTFKISTKEAIKLAAEQRGAPKKEIYKTLLPKPSR